MRITQTVPALALVAGLALTGCTQATPGPKSEPEPAAAPEQTVSIPGQPEGVPPDTEVPADVPNEPKQRKRVKVVKCEASSDGWAASGTAKNPGDKPVTYVVTVFFTTAEATVLATQQTKVEVGAGGTERWSATSKFVAPENTRCVLTGVALG